MKDFDNLYPITIVLDRYNGTYSKGKYLAFNLYEDCIPWQITGDDGNCMDFWDKNRKNELSIGKGDTPDRALEDLFKKLKRN